MLVEWVLALIGEIAGEFVVELFCGSIIKSGKYLWPLVRGKASLRSGCSLIHT